MTIRKWTMTVGLCWLSLAVWRCAGNTIDPEPSKPPTPQSPLSFVEHVVDATFPQTMSATVADFNQDRIPDIAGASYGGNSIAWWQNGAATGFQRHDISLDAAGVRTVTAVDFDQDGDWDLLSATWRGNTLYWWENDSTGSFAGHPVATDFHGAHSARAADLDGDGDLDIIGSAWTDSGDGSICWWENDGSNHGFSEHVLWATPAEAACVAVSDIDRDGDLDIAATVAGNGSGQIILFQNGGACRFTALPVIDNFANAHWLDIGDLDRDGDLDIAGVSCGSVVCWWENGGNLNFQRHVLSSSLNCVSMVLLADLDRDGLLDLVTTSEMANVITWWRNDGQRNFELFTVAGNFRGASGLDIKDMDGDGDPDIVATARYADKVSWWESRPANP